MNIIILLFLVCTSSLTALDYTIETVFGSIYSDVIDRPEASVNGELRLFLLNEKDVTADIFYVVGDNGNYFNRARIKLIRSWYDLSIGRQQIGWGNGYNFNPTDIFNAKPLGAAFDPSYTRKGRDSVILTSYLINILSMEIIYGFKSSTETEEEGILISEESDWDLGGRIKTNLLNYDTAFSFTYTDHRKRTVTDISSEKFASRKLAGISIAGSIPIIDFGVWLEGVYDIDSDDYEFVAGTDYIFWENYTLNIEYYKNSKGEKDNKDYDLTQTFFGDLPARDYLIPSLRMIYSEKMEIAAFSFINLNDKSTTNALVIDYFYNDYLDFIFTPFYMNGSEGSEFKLQSETVGEYGVDFKVRLIY